MSAEVWPPLGTPSPTAHPYEFDGRYRCKVCWSAMHCPHCSDMCGGQGHAMQDDDGFFLSCQEPERAQAWRESFIRGKS